MLLWFRAGLRRRTERATSLVAECFVDNRLAPERMSVMGFQFGRLLLGLAAGVLTVFLVDRFLLPGTLQHGIIGVVVAVAVLAVTTRKGTSDR